MMIRPIVEKDYLKKIIYFKFQNQFTYYEIIRLFIRSW